ncbi:MAG: aminotransferase class I/II-fold pyridoxal phosphate-dependent enzyme, partial [Planctomycetes bacterium]|nr:aminotransferase class I/II-fold pyridoxal phosphate-dependent enzyme [Planctomycetota bacterium]
CSAARALLVLDECFCSFLPEPEKYSLRDQLADHAGLVIIDSFTKLYAMAGIRLGYGISSNARLIEALHRAGQPWSVSSIAQAAGVAALEEDGYVEESLALIRKEKTWLHSKLAELGQEVIGGDANYLFFHSSLPDLAAALADRGILIRDCGNFPGLGKGYYRIAVRTRRENELLIEAVRAVHGSANEAMEDGRG